MKYLINKTKERIGSNRGSLTIEAIVCVTTLLILIFLMISSIKALNTYETIDYCINEAAKRASVHEGYVLLSSSDGLAEQVARPLIVKDLILSEMKSALIDVADERKIYRPTSFKVEELSDFELESSAATYLVSYTIAMPGKSKGLNFGHQVRIRAMWHFENASHDVDEQINAPVYTSKRGREEKIYHTDASCWTLKASWKTPDSVQTVRLETLDGYRPCKICEKNHENIN